MTTQPPAQEPRSDSGLRTRHLFRPRSFGSIQSKLLAMLLLTSIISTGAVGFFGYRSGTKALREATFSRLSEVGDERLKAIQDFIANEKGAVLLDSQGVAVQASPSFNSGFQKLADARITTAQSARLQKYYAEDFVPRLEKTGTGDLDPEAFVPTLNPRRYLQANYVGLTDDFEKSIERDDAGDGSAWTAANRRYNPYFREAARSLGLDDVLMLDSEGNVVYSAYKGTELGSNVVRGEYRGGGLEKVYERAVRSNSRDFVAVADFELYVPSFNAPTMFIASPIGTAGRLTGVLVYEVSGGHFNPAITVGLATAKRFSWKDVPAYVVTQVVSAVVAAFVLWVIAHGVSGFDSTDNFALNGYGDHSPAGFSWWSVLLAELILTAFFLYVILGVTDTRAPKGFAPIAIGLALTLIHLISIPISNTSVNPARSIGPALFGGGDAILQLWVFILAPLVGAVVAGFTYGTLFGTGEASTLEEASEG